jgi:hypothetical protein
VGVVLPAHVRTPSQDYFISQLWLEKIEISKQKKKKRKKKGGKLSSTVSLPIADTNVY